MPRSTSSCSRLAVETAAGSVLERGLRSHRGRVARGAGGDRDARFEYAQRAACLLYRGARNDDLAREAREELSSGASDCDSLGPVLEMVSVVAPFHLDAPCAAP